MKTKKLLEEDVTKPPTLKDLERASRIVLIAVIFVLLWGVLFLSVYLVAIATMLAVVYSIIVLKISGIRQFEALKKLVSEANHGKKR